MRFITFVSAAAVLTASAGLVYATDISGTITSTIVITKNSQLVGDATCNVTGAPCIQFNAANIKLNLNGHVLTGQSARNACPVTTPLEDGIDTHSQNNVMIQGPGLVRRFRERGILISGNASGIYHVTVESNCQHGILVLGHGNFVEENTIVRSSLNGGSWAGIYCGGTGGHVLRENEVIASGPALTLNPPAAPADGSTLGAGNGIVVASNGNVLDTNNVTGNQGIGIELISSGPTAGVDTDGSIGGTSGNSIRNNSAFANFGGLIAVAVTNFTLINGFDISDNNLLGSNSYLNNGCETSFGTDAPTCPNVPVVSGHAIPLP